MMTNFVAHGNILLIALAQFLYLKPRYLPIAIGNFAILVSFLLGVDKILLLEISSILSVIYITMHNKRFKAPSIFYFTSVSIGCFMFAIKETNIDFLHLFIASIYNNSVNDLSYINDIIDLYTFISILFFIGFIPFTEWIIYLFSVSNAFFKITCFIIPMFLSLCIVQDLIRSDNLYIFKYFGASICFYSCLCLFFSRNFCINFVHIMTYFYGLQIMLFYDPSIKLNNWVICSILTIACSDNFMPKRMAKYKYNDVKNIFFSNGFNTLLSVPYFILLVFMFGATCCVLNTKQDNATIIVTNLFICFIAKISYTMFATMQCKYSYIEHPNFKRIIKYILIFLFSISSLINNFPDLDFHRSSFVFSILIYMTTMLFLRFNPFSRIIQPRFLTSRTYSNLVLKIFKMLKTGTLIISSIAKDFLNMLKSCLDSTLFSSILQKIADVLYDKHIYFYIYFLIQVLIVLAIECVIT